MAPQAKFWEKKICVFWKMLTKNRVFSARAPPSKLVYIGAGGALRTILGSVTKISIISK